MSFKSIGWVAQANSVR